MLPTTRLLGGGPRADPIQGLLLPLGPTTPHHDGAIRLACARDLCAVQQSPRLATRASHSAAHSLALPRRRRAPGWTAHGGPAPRAQWGLQRRPLARAVPQQDALGPLGNPRAQQRDQGDVASLGTRPCGTVAHAPRQGPRAPLLHHVAPPRHTATADATARPDHHQRCSGARRQHESDRGDTVSRRHAVRVVEPSGQALDTALGRGAIGALWRDAGPWGARAPHDTAEERRQRGPVPGDGAGGWARRPWYASVPYGTIAAAVVTPPLLLLDGWRFPARVYDGTTSHYTISKPLSKSVR